MCMLGSREGDEMVTSERFERDVRRALRAQERATEEERLAVVGSQFLLALPHIPEPLREELRTWYVDCFTSGDPRFPDLNALIFRLSAVIDIFDNAYDARRTPLDDDEWELIRTLVNVHSPEMKLSTLEYVMQLLMDRGDIG
jgi:hypothetical protein